MVRCVKRICICLLIAAFVWCAGLLSDRNRLNESIIRLHVVANSDSDEDQRIKLQVRDAVLESIQTDIQKLSDTEEAEVYLQNNLPKLKAAADQVLKLAGVDSRAVVTFCKEAFDARSYDTFDLPAGVYRSLRIVIGEGQGHNWWCVAFPSLCAPDTGEEFADTAAGAGFSGTLTGTLADKKNHEVRFFLLDKLGQLENIFCAG